MDDDLALAPISSLTDGQEIALSLLGLFSAALSVLGSSTIVYKVVSTLSKATPYDRLMLGLSSCDVVASITYGMSPFLLPESTSQRVWARGTDTTCTLLGFLTQFAFAAIFYNGMLSFYYLLTVRFGVKRQIFAKRYEKPMHMFTLIFFLGTASAGAAIGLYGEFDLGQGCWLNDYPAGCEEREDCITHYIGWGYAGLPSMFTFLALVINNLVIYFHVRDVLGKSDGLIENEITTRRKTQIREVASQGFLYVGAFFVAYLCFLIIRVLESFGYDGAEDEVGIYPLLVLNAFLLPLQGFFNMFIYNRPHYVRVRAAYPELSAFWAIRKACLDSDTPRLTEARLSSKSKDELGGKQQRNKSGSDGFSSNLGIVREGSNEDASSDEGYTEQGSNLGKVGIGFVKEDPDDEDVGNTTIKTHDLKFSDKLSFSDDDNSLEMEESIKVFREAALSLRRVGMDGTITTCSIE